MKTFKFFKMLAVLIVLITSISQTWGYTFYLYTGNFTSWENKGDGVNPKFQVYVNDKNYDFKSLGNHWYSVDVGNASGTAYVKRCKSTDGTKWNEFSASISSSMNVAFVSDWNAGYFRPMKTYDGETYVYWKVAGNSIPSWWYSGTHKVQMLKYTTGYTGYQTGENLGDNIIRYLVPSGTYADIEVQRENANYSGKFSFDTNTAKNIIYNYTEGGGSGSWSTTYFAYNAYIYFDNTAGLLSAAYKSVCIGRDNTNKYSNCYTLTNISNTKLWTRSAGSISFNDFDGLRFLGTTSEWGEYNGQGPSDRTGYTNRSGSSPQLMDHTSRAYNLFWTTGSTNNSALSHSANSSYAELLHSTQTVNIQISRDGGITWITAPNAPAKVTLHSFSLTNATTSAASNATDIAVNATTVSQSTTAVRTATTTLEYENKKDGYTFVGWYKDNTSQGTGTSLTYYPTAATTHTARFKAHRYTIAFDNNDDQYSSAPAAEGSTTSITNVVYDVNATLTSNGFTRDGYTFAGWNREPDGSGASYTNGQSVSNLTDEDGATVTLYAQWTEDTHTVTLANDGHGHVEIGGSTVTSVSGIGITTASSSITAVPSTGYYFDSWTGDIDNGVTIASGSTTTSPITINATADSKTITANFSPKQCTVTFDLNGGTGGDASVTATYDDDMPKVEIPHKIGYAFDGYWNEETDNDGSGTQYYEADGTSSKAWDVNTTSNQTLYAKWVEDINNFVGYGEGAESVKWNVAANWSRGFVPTNDYSEIHIKRGVNIGEDEAYHVGKIVIDAGSITLINGGVLEVAGTITRTDGAPTETYDISLSSGGSKQNALILDNTAANTQASVSMYTTAAYDPSTSGYSFQYVAVPMTIVNVSDAFSGQNVYTYVWNEGSGWERRGYYYSLFGFEAVGVTSKDGATFHTTGTLVSTADIVNRSLAYTSGDGAGMNMFGNSWTAPVKISEIKVTNGGDYAFYIYESGIWQPYSIADAGDAVIPAMQAYLITVTESGSYSINYDDAVRDAANKTAALRAPKRNASNVAKITLKVTDNERQSNLRLYEGEQFSDEYDRGWEAKYIEGDGNSGQLYAQSDEKMVILATPNMEGTVVGFIPGVADNYTISFEGDGKGYYLNDTELELSTLIAEGNTYEFTPNENTNATRFVISKTPIHQTPTGVEDVNDGTKARKQLIDGVLYIIRDGRIYNTTGALYK